MRVAVRLALALAVLGPACSSSPGKPPAGDGAFGPLFVVPRALSELDEERFFEHPWPSDLRRDPGGAIHVEGFPNRFGNTLIAGYITSMKGLVRGFSPSASGYVRFAAPIDASTLPASPPDTLRPESTVQLVDVDARSPERGTRRLAQVSFHEAEGALWQPNTLAVAPAFGHPLRPATTYAVVITRKVKDRAGNEAAPSATMQEVLGTAAPTRDETRALKDAWSPALDALESAGVRRADVALASVFTTDDPTSEYFAIARAVPAQVEAPKVKDGSWKAKEQEGAYDVYEGTYGPSPNYQRGTMPFLKPEQGGDFVFDASGAPVLQGTFDLRFTLVVPKARPCPMPAAGYPVALYAHGTGGNYRSVIDEGGSIGELLAGKCIASFGIDQIFHGTRPGAAPDDGTATSLDVYMRFFNLYNLVAARTTNRQAAIDYVQQTRLFTESHVSIPATVSRAGAEVRFDASKVIFWGHSQGGINGPLYLAADTHVRGGVLSGAGSMLTVALLEKTAPQPSVSDLVKGLLALRSDEERSELTLFAPVVNLAQTFVDPIDPVNYERYIVREPLAGHAPKSVYLSVGIGPDGKGDNYAPPHGIEIGAVAMGLPRMLPGTIPIPEAAWGGLADVAVPPEGLSGNLANGLATGVTAQFAPSPGSDGHFVLFDVEPARKQVSAFCRSLVDDPVARVPPL